MSEETNQAEEVKSLRREPREIYRPGALKEEREKHRQRAHFGENKLPNQNQPPQSNRRRGGGFERSRGRGVRNGRDNNQDRRSFTTRQPEKDSSFDKESYSEELFRDSPVQSSNWADDEYEESTPVAEPVLDLRDKLNSLRLGKGDSHTNHQNQTQPKPEPNYHHNGGSNGRQPRPHNNRNSVAGNLPRPKKNTENFEPSYDPPEMRILCAKEGLKKYNRPYSNRDVLVVNDLFCEPDDYTIYTQILKELENSGVTSHQLWQLWHGDSHVIADDKRKWKKECPTFMMVIDKIADYFNMDIKATRLNWYRDSSEWKPFHHDAAAVKSDKAQTQNMTVGVSFGMERDAAFEHAITKTVISMPQPNGAVCTFGRDVNILWRHGIPQIPPDQHTNQGRISIIAWGWIEQFEL